jgi:thioredoxin reductase
VIESDVLIVGAGPAGLSAAIELRKLGAGKVLVVDREKEAGGIPRHCNHIGFGLRDTYRFLSGPAYAARYVRLAEKAGVDIQTETFVTGWGNATHLTATSPNGLLELKAKAVVLATGCRERPRAARLIPGSRPAGIFTTGMLQNYVYIHHHPIGKRALVVGADHVGFSAVMTLKHAHTDVLAMVTDLPHHQSYWQYKLVSADRYRVPLWTNQKVTRIVGKKRVEAVELTDVVNGNTRLIECDTVVFTGDWIPDYELSYYGGLDIESRSKSPCVDLRLHTSKQGVFAAGNLLHAAETADVAALSGRHVAHSVSDYLLSGEWPSKPPVGIVFDEPIAWVSPQMIGIGQQRAPLGKFVMRVTRLLHNPTLEIRQGERRLWQKRYRQLIPNLPVYADDGWLNDVDERGESVRFEMICPHP